MLATGKRRIGKLIELGQSVRTLAASESSRLHHMGSLGQVVAREGRCNGKDAAWGTGEISRDGSPV